MGHTHFTSYSKRKMIKNNKHTAKIRPGLADASKKRVIKEFITTVCCFALSVFTRIFEPCFQIKKYDVRKFIRQA